MQLGSRPRRSASAAARTADAASSGNLIRELTEGHDLYADAITLVLSYAFVLTGAWNDRLLGLAPNAATLTLEWLLALGLAAEIVLRILFVRERKWHFWPTIAVDTISVATIVPGLAYFTFARLARILVCAVRLLHLIDAISRRRGNPYLVLLVYPFVVPIAAAIFYAVESTAPQGQVHDYFTALALVLSYTLTIGLFTNHPVTPVGTAVAGIMFLTGLMCVSILGNALTARYSSRSLSAERDQVGLRQEDVVRDRRRGVGQLPYGEAFDEG
jgi:hypothetical protein